MRLPEENRETSLECIFCDTCNDATEHQVSYADHTETEDKKAWIVFYEVECIECGTNDERTTIIEKMLPDLQN